MLIKETGERYTIGSKVIIGVGAIAVVLMIYFAINMYQMVSHVGKLANQTIIMTQQITEINKNTQHMSKDTHRMSANIDSIDNGIENVTSPRGMMNMWRR